MKKKITLKKQESKITLKKQERRGSFIKDYMNEIIGWTIAIITIVLASLLTFLYFRGNSIPIMLGVSSETAQIIINGLVAIIMAALIFVVAYFLTDGEFTSIGFYPATFLFIVLIATSVCSLPSVQERVNQSNQEVTEYSTEMSEYVDPDTGVHYWVQDGGMTPRLNPDGTIMVTSQD